MQHKGFTYLEAWLGLRQVAALEPELLLHHNATVTICHSRTVDLPRVDLLIQYLYRDEPTTDRWQSGLVSARGATKLALGAHACGIDWRSGLFTGFLVSLSSTANFCIICPTTGISAWIFQCAIPFESL